jgi:hypothetical protein
MAATSITTPSDPPKIQIGEKLKAELWRTIFELGRKYENTRDIHEKRRIQAQADALFDLILPRPALPSSGNGTAQNGCNILSQEAKMETVFDTIRELIQLGMIGGGILLFVANCTLIDIRREVRGIEKILQREEKS